MLTSNAQPPAHTPLIISHTFTHIHIQPATTQFAAAVVAAHPVIPMLISLEQGLQAVHPETASSGATP